MNILNKFAIKNLKMNKKRTISTIIGIILSTALVCAFSILCLSIQETLIQHEIASNGYYHMSVYGVNQDDIQVFQKNRDIQNVHIVSDIGYGELEKSQNPDKPYVRLLSMNNQDIKSLSLHLLSGRFPKNEHEIVISNAIAINGGVDLKIGETVSFEIGKRVTENGEELFEYNPYVHNEEKIVNKRKFQFKIVGIIDRPSLDFEEFTNPGYSVVTSNMSSSYNHAFLSFLKPRNYKQSVSEILGVKNYEEVTSDKFVENLKFKHYRLNDGLLRWEVLSLSEQNTQIMYSVATIIIFIIVITSVFCIRNSFAISMLEKKKMYGMLASVGTTKKQIKHNVLYEAFILGIIGIPLGVFFGILAVYILIQVVNMLIGDFMFDYLDGLVFKVSILPIIFSIILSVMTIYFSAISSARKASRISPLDNLKAHDQVKLTVKNLKTPRFIKKIFGIGGTIAYKNLKRSRKKYRTTVISLTVSVFVFITVSSFVHHFFNIGVNYYKSYDYNIKVFGVENEQDISNISDLADNQQQNVLYDIQSNEDAPRGIKIYDESKMNMSYFSMNYIDDENKKYDLLDVKALDDISFKKYCEKIGASYEKMKDKSILCDTVTTMYDETGLEKKQRVYNYKVNDLITGEYNNQTIKKEVGFITDKFPFENENFNSDVGCLIVNKKYTTDFDFYIRYILINSDEAQKLEKEINSLGFGVYNYDQVVRENKSMILVMSIFLYGFITVIILIGITNIFNTISSNVQLRQNEFATLKSVGMTRKEFNKLICLETVFYSVKSLLCGITLGIIGSLALNNAYQQGLISYIPWKPIGISCLFVLFIVYIIMYYSVRKVNNQNIIETIRKENI